MFWFFCIKVINHSLNRDFQFLSAFPITVRLLAPSYRAAGVSDFRSCPFEHLASHPQWREKWDLLQNKCKQRQALIESNFPKVDWVTLG